MEPDLKLCETVLDLAPNDEFAASCLAQVREGSELSSRQRERLRNSSKRRTEDRELCFEAADAGGDSEFVASCVEWLEAGKFLSERQKDRLDRVIGGGD